MVPMGATRPFHTTCSRSIIAALSLAMLGRGRAACAATPSRGISSTSIARLGARRFRGHVMSIMHSPSSA